MRDIFQWYRNRFWNFSKLNFIGLSEELSVLRYMNPHKKVIKTSVNDTIHLLQTIQFHLDSLLNAVYIYRIFSAREEGSALLDIRWQIVVTVVRSRGIYYIEVRRTQCTSIYPYKLLEHQTPPGFSNCDGFFRFWSFHSVERRHYCNILKVTNHYILVLQRYNFKIKETK